MDRQTDVHGKQMTETGPHLQAALRADLASATTRLTAAGVESPRADAELLAAYVLGIPRSRLVLAGWSEGARDQFLELLTRRERREPLQHIVGSTGFRHLELLVGPGVFVPRPETESVVEWAMSAIRDLERPLIVDLCTGSGAIALSLAYELPRATVHAVERDSAALAWTRRNVEATGTGVTLHQMDITGDVPAAFPDLAGRFDLVISNPPYVAEHESVEPEVGDHDPAVALWAGADGLDLVRAVERAARGLLRPGGVVVVEHSDRQGETAPAVFQGWDEVADHRDLVGRDRFVTARLPLSTQQGRPTGQ
jgi:release factor glutamine methyltransferase